MFAKFYEIPSMIRQDIKETKRYAHIRSDGREDSIPSHTVCGGYNYDGLESPMLHTKFHGIRPAGSGEDDF